MPVHAHVRRRKKQEGDTRWGDTRWGDTINQIDHDDSPLFLPLLSTLVRLLSFIGGWLGPLLRSY